MMRFDYSKLLGRIKECGYTQESLATEVGMAVSTMSLKLNNKAFFSQPEMKKICELLSISVDRIGEYFFAPEVQKN